MLVDDYADWCVACNIMEKHVFGRDDVMAGLDGEERRAHRITGEVNAEEFLQRWQATRESG